MDASAWARDDFAFLVAGGLALLAVAVGGVWWLVAGTLRGIERRKDLPVPSLARPLVPFERYALETPIPAQEITRTLFDLDGGLRRPTYQSRQTARHGAGAFRARLSEDGFVMRRSSPSRGSDSVLDSPYLPVVVAVIRPSASGSTLEVTLRLAWFNAVPLALVAVAAASAVVQSPTSWPLLMVAGVLHTFAYLLGWRPERARALSFLSEALRLSEPARARSTPPPAAEVPGPPDSLR